MSLLTSLGLCWSIPHNLIRHFEEHLVNIASCFSRCFKEFEAVFLGKRLALLLGNNPVWEVCFVCNEHLSNSRAGMSFNLLEPIDDVAKSALFSAIVNQDYAHGTLVVCLRNCSEALLSGSVPHLQLNSLILHVDRLDLEVNAYIIT